jgi:hypothetical protein
MGCVTGVQVLFGTVPDPVQEATFDLEDRRRTLALGSSFWNWSVR